MYHKRVDSEQHVWKSLKNWYRFENMLSETKTPQVFKEDLEKSISWQSHYTYIYLQNIKNKNN